MSFQFNSKLDIDYLNYFYSDDVEYSADIFNAFLIHSIPEFNKIRPLIESGNWDAAWKIAHKLRSKFPMVGLTNLETKMSNIQKAIKTNSPKSKVMDLIMDFENEVQNFLPILKEDLEKMKKTLT